MSESKMIVAICYDFDGTLSPGNVQEYNYFPELKLKPKDFWAEASELARSHSMDPILAYMKLMLDKANASGKVEISRKAFASYGKLVKLFKGVESWFKRINSYGRKRGVEIEHYIISSGIREMIEGTKISKNFKEIYACSFMYDQHDVAQWPAVAVNYTTKTQFLFRINKGVTDFSDNKIVNNFIPEDKRRIPFARMIYLGDGETDVPCMKLVKENGGHSIAVYDSKKTGKKRVAGRLLKEGRVNYCAEASYNDNSRMDLLIKAIIDGVVAERKLELLREHKL